MGRAAIALGTQDCRSRVMDRSADELLFTGAEHNAAAALGAARTGPLLPGAPAPAETCSCNHEASAEAEVVLPRLWCQLALTERQRFGHCFSSLLLKALGRGTDSTQEVEP